MSRVRRSVPRAARLVLLPVAAALGAPAGVADAGPQDACVATAAPDAGLDGARALFAERCPGLESLDCDPAPGGWTCSSEVIGSSAPPSGPCSADGADLRAARAAFDAGCPGRARLDCDPVGSGWTCSTRVIGETGSADPVVAGSGPAVRTAAAPAVRAAPPSPATSPVAPPVALPAPTPVGDGGTRVGLLGERDLLVLTYDGCAGPGDGQSAAAARSVVSRLGLGVPWVIDGACGTAPPGRGAAGAVPMRELWGDGWVDARGGRAGAVAASADAWASVLANGDDVWIAEGGPSDVTAEIVRRIERRYPSLDPGRVHVVQHSRWNEDRTSPADLVYLKSRTDYLRIGDGNGSGSTAGLNPMGDDFRAVASRFAEIAAGGPFAAEWRAAFDRLPPGCPDRTERCKLDFSDTVALLHIVGDRTTIDVLGFAERYLR